MAGAPDAPPHEPGWWARVPGPLEDPPRDELGVGVPLQPVLVDQPELLVAVTDITAYSTGITFALALHARGPGAGWLDGHAERDVESASSGIRPSSGRWRFDVVEPTGALREMGGGGGNPARERYWLSPLPAEGDVRLACRWPDRGIAEREGVVPGVPLRDAAARSRPLWDGPRMSPWPQPVGGSQTGIIAGSRADSPEWLEPPTGSAGVPASLELVLAHTHQAAAAIRNVVVHPTGLQFTLAVRRRAAAGALDEVGGLGLGVQFADGRRARERWPGPDLAPAGAILYSTSGRGDELAWDERFWLGPLPPDGPLGIDFRWPAAGVGARRFEVDASALRARLSRTSAEGPA